jgi:hypothetical protein
MEEQETTEEQTADEHAEEAEMMARLQEEIRSLPVRDHLLYMMQSLSSLAVGWMGLAPDDVPRRDMDQARLAIDAFKALVEVVEKVLPTSEVTAHRGALSQLQLAYVGALGAVPAGGAAKAAPAAREEPADASEAPAEGSEAPDEAPEEADRS